MRRRRLLHRWLLWIGVALVPLIAHAHIIDFLFGDPDAIGTGSMPGGLVGRVVALADVNGDQRDDLIIGAPGVTFAGRTGCGALYIVISSDTLVADTLGTLIRLEDDRDDVKRIYGPASGSALGTVLAAGDVTGDGFADIVCGIPGDSPAGRFLAGRVWILTGSATPPDTIDLASPPAGATTVLGGAVFDRLGSALAVGNVNGDTYPDVVIGAPFASPPGNSFAGKAYIMPGGPVLPATVDVASAAAGVIRVWGENANDTFGTALRAADVDADLIADIVVAAPQSSPVGRSAAGTLYVLSGSPSLPDTIRVTAGAPALATRIVGPAAGTLAGSGIAAGDIDNDGIVDLIIGAPEATAQGRSKSGITFVVPGRVSFPDTIDLAEPVASMVRIDGPAANMKTGLHVTTGDVNSDGFDDVVIGVPEATPAAGRQRAGIGYLVFGRSIFPLVLDLSTDFNGVTAVRAPQADLFMGGAVAAGRVDTDGFDDLILGAAGPAHDGAGRVFLLLGGPDVIPTHVRDVAVDVPPISPGARMRHAAPNPFQRIASIPFWLPRAGQVEIHVYDVTGARVAVATDRFHGAGDGIAFWDGLTRSGAPAPSGVYFVQMRFEGRLDHQKIVRLR